MDEQVVSAWRPLLANLGPTEHAVQIYQDDNFFGDAVSHFAAHGLWKNESIIIVATKAHWENIAGRLINEGFDVDELRRAGQLTLLDADETLPKFLVNNMPDGRTFKDIAHSTIEKARANGRYANVRWWGEMVNVLYVGGNGRASTRLEELFDEVAHEESIAIFCSFLMDKFDRKVYDGPLQNVCRTHVHLIPSENYARHKECVNRALLEVFRGMESQLFRWLGTSKHWVGPEMPASQALLLMAYRVKTADSGPCPVVGEPLRAYTQTDGGRMSYITESGIPDLGKIPWGSHFCQMYSTKNDLAQSLIPYFMAGLVNNERCIWITSEPYSTEDATADFRKILPGFGTMMKEGRLKILDYAEWYTSARSLEGRITQHWLEEEQRSLSEGYEGLRISGNLSFVTPSAWDAFMEYEREIDQTLNGRRIIALCSYNATQIEPTDVFDMVRAHQFSICRNNGFWEMLDSNG